MSPEQMANAVQRVLSAFSCPEIESALPIPGEPNCVGIEGRDGSMFVMEVTEP